MAKDLAREVGYIYVDTGAMYRAVTLFALRHGLFNDDGSVQADELERLMPQVKVSFKLDPATHLPLVCLNGECVESDIRGLEVSSHVSPIAALPFTLCHDASAAGDGTRQRHRNGWSRHRHSGISRGRT